MERSLWMYKISRLDPLYISGVDSFIDAAKNHALRTREKHIYCPCTDCKNVKVSDDSKEILSHLVCRGFMKDYLIWTKHGEGSSAPYTPGNPANIEDGPDMLVDGGFHLVSERPDAQDPADAEHVVRNATDPCFAGGNDGNGPHDLANNMAAEDAEFLEAMLRRHTEDPSSLFMKGMEALKKAAEEPLYDESKGCTKEFTTLRSVLKLLMCKARYGISDAGFDVFLTIIGEMLPKDNKVPANTYYAKKLISPLTMGVEKIHACRNHCILYRGDDYKYLDSCPKCGASRYKTNKDYRDEESAASMSKGKKRKKNPKSSYKPRSKGKEEVDYYAQKKIPALVMWYLPVVDRLRCLFANPDDAKLMSWHASKEHKNDGKLRHPADGQQWKDFNDNHKDFANESRNVRFALCTDGMNPFAERSSTHSTWPVILTIYNLPPWLMQKRKYLLLTILISGPSQPGVDIDVFLEPLMEEMKMLFEIGVKIWDEHRKESFTLRAIIFVTINDYPALFVLSGQFKGKVGCVVCIDGTSSVFLTASKKLVYMRHRRFLSNGHRYRKTNMDKYFDNNDELHSTTPSGHNEGKRVFRIVSNLKFTFGKKTKDGKARKDVKPNPGDTFKKKSIFFEYLSYWPELEVRHAIDGMHIQKNVFESLVGTLLDIPRKTKEGLSSRKDMVQLGIKEELHPVLQDNGKYHLPAGSYNLNDDEKHALCVWLKNLKVPSGFCSSIRSIVSVKNLTLTNYNSHDCHVMLTTFLPIAIRAINPVRIKVAVTRLCYLFNRISQKVVNRKELDSLKEFAVETLSQFEMCFPPAFFDMMVHLVVHLVPQIEALGPMYLHEMWTYERFMSVLNGYVSTRARPEASMVEGYLTEEAIDSGGPFCNRVLKDQVAIGLPPSRHEGRLNGRGRMGNKLLIPKDYNTVLEAHHSILHQLSIMEPLIQQHIEELCEQNQGHTDQWIMKEHKIRFTSWLREQDIPNGDTLQERTIKVLASGPSRQVRTWQTYDISGFTFCTKSKDKKSIAQNSGVRCDALDSKTGKETIYFGFVEDIWEVDYGIFQIPVFRCQWVEDKHVKVDNYGVRVLDLSKVGYKDDPWIMANRAAQVFYAEQILSPNEKKSINAPKHVVFPGKQQAIGVDGVTDLDEFNEFSDMSLFVDKFQVKITNVEKNIPEDSVPWVRPDGQGKTVAV